MIVLSDKVVTARKRHTCDQCLKHIDPPERYRRQVYTRDGFTVYKAHECCDNAATELFYLWRLRAGDDDGVLLHSDVDDPEDVEFLIKEFHAVAEKLGMTR